MTADFERQLPTLPQQHCLPVPRNYLFSGPKILLTHRYCSEKDKALIGLPATTKVQPSAGDSTRPIYPPFCSLHINHCDLAQLGLQGRSGLTFPPFRFFKSLGKGKWQIGFMQNPHILDTDTFIFKST